jgi:hypothetical protein
MPRIVSASLALRSAASRRSARRRASGCASALGALGLDEQVRHGRAVELELVRAMRGHDGGLEGGPGPGAFGAEAEAAHQRERDLVRMVRVPL